MTDTTGFVIVDGPRSKVAPVTLNRPERMNSMAFDVMAPLKAALERLRYDNSLRVRVLTGAGTGFSFGADHKSAGLVPHLAGLTRPSCGLRSMELLDDGILTMRRLHRPVTAAVNGAELPAAQGDRRVLPAGLRVDQAHAVERARCR